MLGGLALALGIGLLIGVERGWRQRGERAGSRVAGVRTFGLLGLLGGVAGVLATAVSPWIAVAVVAAAAAALVVSHRQDMIVDGQVSATTTIAALVTLGLGVLATGGLAVPAAAAGAAMAALLAARRQLHGWLARMSERDVQATARFAIITALVLPLLPDARFGPYGAWNPRELWLVVVLVTGFSFAGYIANRMFGARRGMLATAAIGGLYSSTAVTAALSRRLAERTTETSLAAAGIALASALMFGRVLALTAILATSALPSLALAIGPGAVLALGLSVVLVRRSSGAESAADPAAAAANPFELLPALGFAALVAMLALAVRWAEVRFGGAGVAVLIAITGSFDVDAAIVTLGGLPAGTLEPRLAGLVLAVPVLLNTLFKAAVVLVLAGWRRGLAAAAPLLASAAAIAAMLAALAV